MKNKYYLFATCAIVLLMANCKSTQKSEAAGSELRQAFNSMVFDTGKPFKNIDLPSEEVNVNPDKERAFTFADGSSIEVPDHAFTDKDGKEVSGDVKLRYKSIKSAGSIIASGLHLLYKQGDSIVPFTTGGMFEIDAKTASGQQLKLKDGKALKVNFTAIDGQKYNLYRMNETTKQWEEVGDANTLSATKEDNKTEDKSEKLLKPVAFDENKDMVINVNVDYHKMQELTGYNKIIWKYSGDKSKQEVGEILNKRWKSAGLVRSNKGRGVYQIELKQDDKTENIEVSPVFSKAAYTKAVATFNKSQQTEKKEVASTGSSRSLSVIGLGTYNLDICGTPDVMALNAEMKFDKEEYNQSTEAYKYFVVSNNGQSITRYDLTRSKLLVFYKGSPNKLIGLLPDNRVGVFTSEEFNKIKAKNNDKVTFNLKVLPNKIENEKQLDDIIAKI